MDRFSQKVFRSLQRDRLLEPGQPVLAAVSGGPDSVALLLLMDELKERLKIRLYAAHVNHQLRGQESEEDQLFVEELCGRLKVELFRHRATLKKRTGNLEAAARRVRYQFFSAEAARLSAVVATGHTLDDQAETLLMRLFSGAGPAGLSGIRRRAPFRMGGAEVVVVRPLLEMTRFEILRYLEQKGQSYRQDRMNLDQRLDRNWIRHHLLPQIEERLNPRVSRTLSQTARLLGEIDHFLDEQADEFLRNLGGGGEEQFLLPVPELLALPAAVQRQVIRTSLNRLGLTLPPRMRHVEKVLELCRKGSGKEIHLPSGVRALREFDTLRLTHREQAVEHFAYPLPCPGLVLIAEVGKTVSAQPASSEPSENQILVPAPLDRLIVRNRRPGDRFGAKGRESGRSLKKALLEKRIPRCRRDTLLILEAAGRVVWVEGFGSSATFRLRSDVLERAIDIRVESETFPG